MEATVVQNGKMQPEQADRPSEIYAFRWSRWVDGDGKLWIVVGSWRSNQGGKNVDEVELLDVDNEVSIRYPRAEFKTWVRTGSLKRVDLPIAV